VTSALSAFRRPMLPLRRRARIWNRLSPSLRDPGGHRHNLWTVLQTAKELSRCLSETATHCDFVLSASGYILSYLLYSKEGNRVAAAVVHRDNTKCVRLPDTASIFRAELYAVLFAIDVVRRSKEKQL